MKILIIRFSSLGDIVLTSPVPRLIKKRFPNSEVHFLTKKIYSEIYVNNINFNKIYLLDRNFFHLYRKLKKNNYDLIIDLHNNIRSFIIRKSLGIKYIVYNTDDEKLTNMLIRSIDKIVPDLSKPINDNNAEIKTQ